MHLTVTHWRTATINLDCQLGWIWNHSGDRTLCVIYESFKVHFSREGRPTPMDWRPRLNKETRKKQTDHQHPFTGLCFLTVHTMSPLSLTPLIAAMPCYHDGLFPLKPRARVKIIRNWNLVCHSKINQYNTH